MPLFFLSEQRGTTGTRKRVCPYDVVVITTPMYEKKHWDGDLADLTGQCVKVGHELFELFERYRYTVKINRFILLHQQRLDENILNKICMFL